MENSIFKNLLKNIFYDSYKTQLKQDLDKVAIKNLDNKINRIFTFCKGKSEKLLIVGQVQSGKTNLFLGLISKLFDTNTNIVFIMAGVDKDIYSQNLERIKKTFNKDILNKYVQIFSDKDKNIESIITAIQNNKKVIICSLKNYSNLNKWSEILKNVQSITKTPIIIDDEGDQFSFKDINKKEFTKTHESILKIFSSLNDIYTFVSVTATPYAHILVESEDKIKPDYAFVTETNANYIGINFFNESICDNREDITQIIPSVEVDDFFSQNDLGDMFNESLISFMFNGTILFLFLRKNPEMLINPDFKKQSHDDVANILKLRIKILSSDLNDHNSLSYKKLENLYSVYKESDMFKNYDYFSFEDIKNQIINFLNNENNFSYLIINGKNKIDSTMDQRSIFNFYIGSNKLSRGITLKNLITSFIFRNSKSSSKNKTLDTIYQMARWLGYRNEYKYLINLYITEDTYKSYINIDEVTQNTIINILKKAEDEGLSIKELERQIEINTINPGKNTLATRTTVAKQKDIYKSELFKEIFFTNKWKKYTNNENDLTDDLTKKIIKKIKSGDNIFQLNNISLKINNYPSTYFKNLDVFSNWYGRSNVKELFSYIGIGNTLFEQIISNYKDKEVIVSIMTKNNDENIFNFTPRMRKYDIQKNEIVQPFVGANENYIGDRYWEDETENKYIFIQLHTMNIKTNLDDTSEITTITKIIVFMPSPIRILNGENDTKIYIKAVV